MSLVAGPFLAAAGLLAAAGVLKVVRPESTARALQAAGLPAAGPLRSAVRGRVVGVAELVVATVAVGVGGRVAAGVLAGAYLSFAVFTARLLRTAGAGASCGCFGAEESPASTVHVWVNSLIAALGVAAVVDPVPGLRAVLADQPLAGAPFLVFTALCGWLLFVMLTVVPDLQAAIAGPGEPSR